MGFVKSQKFTRVATFPSCIIICQTRLMFLTTRKLVRWLRPRTSDGKCHIRFIHWAPDHNGRKVWDTLKDVYLVKVYLCTFRRWHNLHWPEVFLVIQDRMTRWPSHPPPASWHRSSHGTEPNGCSTLVWGCSSFGQARFP